MNADKKGSEEGVFQRLGRNRCGKALPYRQHLLWFFREAQPRESFLGVQRKGIAFPHGRRQSRWAVSSGQ
jgi:hypothetical protein